MTIKSPLYTSLGNKEPEHGSSYVLFSRVTSFLDICIGNGVERERLTTNISSGKKLIETLKEDKRLDYLCLDTKLRHEIITQSDYVNHREFLNDKYATNIDNSTTNTIRQRGKNENELSSSNIQSIRLQIRLTRAVLIPKAKRLLKKIFP